MWLQPFYRYKSRNCRQLTANATQHPHSASPRFYLLHLHLEPIIYLLKLASTLSQEVENLNADKNRSALAVPGLLLPPLLAAAVVHTIPSTIYHLPDLIEIKCSRRRPPSLLGPPSKSGQWPQMGALLLVRIAWVRSKQIKCL